MYQVADFEGLFFRSGNTLDHQKLTIVAIWTRKGAVLRIVALFFFNIAFLLKLNLLIK